MVRSSRKARTTTYGVPVRNRSIRLKRHAKIQFLQHDNSRPHTSIATTELIAKFDWTVLPYPPYSSDLAPSDLPTSLWALVILDPTILTADIVTKAGKRGADIKLCSKKFP
uniref:Tc1-like transposase DDE domain-containing protein n=1 Tax=Photinus pyralis TaxID=7054 RepID=A0A1Y1LWM2_PHOPY